MNKAFQALADPTRRTILKKLNKGEMTAGQVVWGCLYTECNGDW